MVSEQFEPYQGTLTRGKMSQQVQRAYWIWTEQRKRCTNPSNACYATYGARGIRVEYDARSFIGWYLHALTVQPTLKSPHVGRRDHGRNYSFDNILLQEGSDNAREAGLRCAPSAKLSREQVEEIRRESALSSTALAARFGVSVAAISYVRNRKTWRDSPSPC